MAQGQSGGMRYNVQLEGVEDILNATKKLPAELRKQSNREFRDAAREISTTMAAEIRTGRYARGAPQAREVAATAVYKRDRLPVVRIPGTRIGLSGQSTTGKRSSATGRLLNYRKKGTAGRKEDLQIAWAATGGLPNPHFPGSVYWLKYVYDDAERLGAREWLSAANSVLRRFGL